MTHPIETWHQIVAQFDRERLSDLLTEDCTFWSPVVHTPQRGRQVTMMYLTGAAMVFQNTPFRYVREVIGERDAVLEFETEIDGIFINGVDMIHWNDDGKIDDFKVMIRPLKAVNLLHQKMGAMLESFAKGRTASA